MAPYLSGESINSDNEKQIESHSDLDTQVWYLIKDPKFDTEKPFYSNIPFEHPEAKQTNLESTPEEVVIHNIRGHEDDFELDKQGFQVLRKSSVAEYSLFESTDWIQDVYYPEIEKLLRQAVGESQVERVYIYDHTIRRRNPTAPVEWRGEEGALQPVPAAHVDHSNGSGPTRVRAHLEDKDAENLLGKRYQIINIWHPLFGPVEDWPLGLCDARSVEKCDLVPTDLIYPHYFGEIYSLTSNQKHTWWYLGGQMPDEVLFFKCFDSKKDCARFTPHCGFINPKTPPESRPRESIEFRAMVFHKT